VQFNPDGTCSWSRTKRAYNVNADGSLTSLGKDGSVLPMTGATGLAAF
jgi:hypothetical protein